VHEKPLSLVSIVTPSYNQAAYLEFAIQSVLAQDYPDVEYLVVDGGSSDGSLAVIQRYADRLAWWVSEPDSGQAEAINKGFARANGEYIAWLNSDDLYLPGAISQAVAALEADPELVFVFGNAVTIDAQGELLNRLEFRDWGMLELMAFRIICQPAVFMRRRALQQAGYLDLSYHFMLDHQLWLRLARLGPVRHITQSLAAARHHATAKNVAQAAGFGREIFNILEWMEAQPDLASHLAKNRRVIEAGAYRLDARYLLDAGQPARALRSYGRALTKDPPYALKHWHRMAYAAASQLGMGEVVDRLLVDKPGRGANPPVLAGVENWPGLAGGKKP
jgi:glycosyltransferase involved in cell wall biosynthesis